MRKPMFVVGMFALTLAVAPACATKKFVRTSVGEVNEKVGTMGKSLEETQERVRQNEGKIAEVDQARRGREHRRQAAAVGRRTPPNTPPPKSASAPKRAPAAIEAETRKLIFETVLSEDQGKFKFGKAELPDEAKAAIDQMVGQPEGRQEGRVDRDRRPHRQRRRPEVQRALGHEARRSREALSLRAAPGAAAQDQRDQLRRREAGAPNKTRDGRAQNRRVVIKVLA